jgi:hypothetical protein
MASARVHVRPNRYTPRGDGRDAFVYQTDEQILGVCGKKITKHDVYSLNNSFWKKHESKKGPFHFATLPYYTKVNLPNGTQRDIRPHTTPATVPRRIPGYAGHIPSASDIYGRSISKEGWEKHVKNLQKEEIRNPNYNKTSIYRESFKPHKVEGNPFDGLVLPPCKRIEEKQKTLTKDLKYRLQEHYNFGKVKTQPALIKFVSPVRNRESLELPKSSYPIIRQVGYSGHIPQNPKVPERYRLSCRIEPATKSHDYNSRRTTWERTLAIQL